MIRAAIFFLIFASQSKAAEICPTFWDQFKKEEQAIESKFAREGFFQTIMLRNLIGKSSAYAKLNRAALQSIREIELPKDIPNGYKGELTMSEIRSLYKTVAEHPVAKISNRDLYDPEGIGLGFCFGRAVTTHLEALWNYKLANVSIRKLWMVGNVGPWDFHVTAIVRGPKGQWYAIDPTLLRPVTVESWYRHYFTFAKVSGTWIRDVNGELKYKGGVMLFHSKAKRFSMYAESAPGSVYTGSYQNGKWVDNFNSYFVDLFSHYKEQRKIIVEDSK